MRKYSFQLPDLGEGIVESEISQWYIRVGDTVEQDQHIADIQTDKAIIETSSPVSGKVLALGCKAGELLAVGSELVLFETSASPSKQSLAKQSLTKQSPEKQSPTKNETVEKNKSTTESTTKSNAQKVEQALSTPKPITQPIKTDNIQTSHRAILTSPSVRLRARQHNIDLNTITGSGPNGRINHSDLDVLPACNTEGSTSLKTDVTEKTAPQNLNATTPKKSVEASKTYALKGTRRLIAHKLQLASQQIPHYSYVEEVDVTLLEQQRYQLNENRIAQQNKITLLPFIIQALVKSLPQFPHCNAHFNNEKNEVTEFENINIGIATMTENGLVVPVLNHCENLNVQQCADGITQLASAARNNQLKSEQITGSTITITSLGKLGGLASTPIINAPETCIIGINKIQQRPVVIDNAIAIRSMMNISASFDHRVVDGFDGASLVQAIKTWLENPKVL